MTSYRRGKSRTHSNKNRRNRSVHTRGCHQGQWQVNNSSGDPGYTYASDHHGGVPPSPASSAPGMRLGTAHNAGGNPNARQPGTFRTAVELSFAGAESARLARVRVSARVVGST